MLLGITSTKYRIARNFGGQNFGGFAKNRFWRLIFWRIDAKADIHAHVYPILVVKILAFREQSAKSAKILTTKISRYTVCASLSEGSTEHHTGLAG